MDIQIPMKMKVRPNHLRSIAISIIPEGEGEGGHVSNNVLICCLFKGGYWIDFNTDSLIIYMAIHILYYINMFFKVL